MATDKKVNQERSLIVYAGLGGAVAALVLFAWLATEVLGGASLRFDSFVRNAVHSLASPGLTSVMRNITLLGSVQFLVVICASVIAALAMAGRRRAAIVLAIAAGGAELLNEILKELFHRTRPDSFFGYQEPVGYSFPSGHALMSCCIYGVMAVIFTARLKSRAAKALVWTATALLCALIGLSRIYLGVHYPSDVVAGYAAAIIWVTALWLAYGAWLRRLN